MDNRILMAKYRQDTMIVLKGGEPMCGCGQHFKENETVLLYPNPDYNHPDYRDMVCMTCHFWFVHDVLSEAA